MIRRPPRSTRTDTLFPYTTLFRSECGLDASGWTSLFFRGVRLLGQHLCLSLRTDFSANPAIDFICGIFERRTRTHVCTVRVGIRGNIAAFAIHTHKLTGLVAGSASIESDLQLVVRARSEERRVGNECVSTCRSGGSP